MIVLYLQIFKHKIEFFVNTQPWAYSYNIFKISHISASIFL